MTPAPKIVAAQTGNRGDDAVLLEIVRFCAAHDWQQAPSCTDLMLRLNCSEQQLRDAIRRLVDRGFLRLGSPREAP